ncbi:MAG: NAD(P)/FAD-dependent oxidoreductase [Mycobacterium sp.]
MDVRRSDDGFASLRTVIARTGRDVPEGDVGVRGQPLTVGEWSVLIDEFVSNPSEEAIWNVATTDEDAREYDAIFIGGGAAGRFGSAYLRARGGRQLVIDAWPFLGGSCPHQACVPHHLFSECARELDLARTMSGKLWYPQFEPDNARILDVVELFRSGRAFPHAVMNWQSKEQLGLEYVLNSRARVIDEHTVEADGHLFRAKNIVLCTGARTLLPDIPGTDLDNVYDFASLVDELDYEPTRCVVIGGSKVAVEYASFFQATGCQTTILSRRPVLTSASLHHVDDGLRGYVVEMMVRRGITFEDGVQVLSIEGDRRATSVCFRDSDGSRRHVPCDMVFIATGERPMSAPFVEALGIDADERGFITTDRMMRTSVDGVWAAGDLLAGPMEMFKARRTGVAAARNIMGDQHALDLGDYPDFLHTTYEVTWLGLSEQEARQRYGNVVTIQMPPDAVNPETFPLPAAEGSMLYSFVEPALSGWFKLVIDGDSRRIVGAHHVGYGAKDAFQYLDYLVRRPEGLTIDEIGELNELYLNPEHFIQLSRIRAGQEKLEDL